MSFEQSPPVSVPELWAGVECTVNRVGDAYYDQLEQNGHARRGEDLELFAALGARAVRYPVLWERTAPDGLDAADWSWADARLARLRELHLRPVVGLVHHGSGPRDTNLLDERFADKLSLYARAVAERYPWVEDYTPVNEPLTTARFSCLYGHWYPHARDALSFARALLNQCRGVALSMRAVREVNPAARLVQTEDLGKTYGTRLLGYQAEFENERRWLTWDLLAGRVVRGHAMWDFLKWLGVGEREVEWFAENPCPPDIIGVNHYVTSERFLDERLARYPAHTHGGNGQHVYADVEAVRARADGVAGARVLLREAWERYGLPLAITEAHLGCTREEQMRWFKEVWDGACELRREEVDVRAVTAWSMLGSFDWDSLLTRAAGRYESGVFDLRRAPAPRPTALARMMKELSEGREYDHPVLDSPGWWRRLERLLPSAAPNVTGARASRRVGVKGGRPILITGGAGALGRALARACERRGLAYVRQTRAETDIADAASVAEALARAEPWAVVNAAGYARIDEAEREHEACHRENAQGPATLAAACTERGLPLVTFSSEAVFDGAKRAPYVEGDSPAPLNVYGRSKAEAEARVLDACPAALVVRTSCLFGPWDEESFLAATLRALEEESEWVAADDAVVSPTYLPDLADACLDLLIDGERGVWHLANAGALTWADFARLAAERGGYSPSLVRARPLAALSLAAPRPSYAALGSERGQLLPPLEDALGRYFDACEVRRPARRRAEERTG